MVVFAWLSKPPFGLSLEDGGSSGEFALHGAQPHSNCPPLAELRIRVVESTKQSLYEAYLEGLLHVALFWEAVPVTRLLQEDPQVVPQ